MTHPKGHARVACWSNRNDQQYLKQVKQHVRQAAVCFTPDDLSVRCESAMAESAVGLTAVVCIVSPAKVILA
jgi:hypothetical protein